MAELKVLEGIVSTSSYEQVNCLFQSLVRSTKVYRKDTPIASLPAESMHERLNSVLSRISSDLTELLKKKDENINVYTVILAEIIRYAYSKEMLSYNPGDEFWVELKNDLVKLASNFGVKLDTKALSKFQSDVSMKCEKIKNKKKSQLTEESKKIARQMNKKAKSLWKEYVGIAAGSLISDSSNLSDLAITSNALLAIASTTINPDKLLKMETAVIEKITLVRSSFVMPQQMLEAFMEKYNYAAKSLTDSAGSVIVHHPEDVKGSDVDNAVKQYLFDRGDDLLQNIAVWNPELSEEMKKK